MSYISLYRKYRPHRFSDVVGQDIIVKILKNSIVNNNISHAYIFSGPRGTGKTSIAKIFSKVVNCLNPIDGDLCDQCESCLSNIDEQIDIVEIDAASNNGVDEIREIRNNVKLMPSSLKYRVYIIDEVHMLSTSAFNALLKTLEEPPSYTIFILATTEINKIPPTVISRCQKFDFKKISNNDILNRLKYIVKNEGKEISEDILELIAELSNGGLRDAINLLDQLLSIDSKNITRTDVFNVIGDIDEEESFKLLEYIFNADITNIIDLINNYNNQGKNFTKIVNKLENIVKDILIFNSTNNYFSKEYEDKLVAFSKVDIYKIIDISKELFNLNYELKRNNNQKIVCEIYFIKMCLLFDDIKEKSVKIEVHREVKKEEKPIEIINKDEIKKQEINEEIEDENKKIFINNCLCGANKQLKNDFIEKYGQINEYLISKTYNSIANLLIKATPEVVSDKLVIITFNNSFEVSLAEKNKSDIKKLIKKIYKNDYDLIPITVDDWKVIKKEYINNIKNGVEYKYIEPKTTIIKKKKSSKIENNIEDIFGEKYKVVE